MADLPDNEQPSFSPSRMELERASSSLYFALKRNCHRLANWYLGGYKVLASVENPDRIASAAHSFREVMEKFPECAGLRVSDIAGNAANVLKVIQVDLVELAKTSQCAASGWKGEIDAETRQFLTLLHERLEEFARRGNSRTEQMREVIGSLVPGASALADSHHRAFLRSWNKLRSFFANVAHHDSEPDEEAFRERVSELEQLMGAQLTPEPTDDMDLIDQMIKEAESGN